MNTKRVLTIMGLFLAALLCMAQEKKPEVPALTRGQSLERELKSGETQVYRVKLAKGEFLQLAVDRGGIDFMLTLSTEDRKKLTTGVEVLSYIATANGTYLIEVKWTDDSKSGRYLLLVDGPRVATERDKKSVDAERSLREGTALADENTPESQEKAIEKFKGALSIYQVIKDRRGEASALSDLGMAYDYLKLYKEALGYYEQTLLLKRELKDRGGEAAADVNLSFANFHLDQYEEARKYMDEALAIYREIKDKKGESEALQNLDFIKDKSTQAKTPPGAKDQAKPQTNKSDQRCRELLCNAYACWWHYFYC